MGNLERLKLEQLECDLLGKHTVTDGKSTLGHEAQETDTLTGGIELLDVQLESLVDAVASSSGAARYFDVAAPLVLLALRCRQIRFEELGTSLVWLVAKQLEPALPRGTVSDQTNKRPQILA